MEVRFLEKPLKKPEKTPSFSCFPLENSRKRDKLYQFRETAFRFPLF
jgi:hypothetical protein